ncbi:hypothetical protein ACQCN2_01980 [Brevibacillus ginsengisoli]|uniref:hypothetical protein n=1 Tax=Brevibacillus ginsengisoli TaxID=363854 RepID=UPI003CF62483
MFYHGINREYIHQQYPVLSPRRSVSQKNQEERLDRQHLIEKLGIEPIHLLESSQDYPKERCIEVCLEFGDTVLEFASLPDPMWQLSRHEVGTIVLDVRKATMVYVQLLDESLLTLFNSARISFIKGKI